MTTKEFSTLNISRCSCSFGCSNRAEMRGRHGTPERFAVSVYNGVPSFISVGEAEASIARYSAEYAAAPESLSTEAEREQIRARLADVPQWQAGVFTRANVVEFALREHAAVRAECEPLRAAHKILASEAAELLNECEALRASAAKDAETIAGLRDTATKLWKLLDDISTLSDAAKSDDAGFRKHALDIAEKRSEHFISRDGYTLEPAAGRETP